MAARAYLVIEVAKRYLEELERNNIPVQEAIIFGSYAKGSPFTPEDFYKGGNLADEIKRTGKVIKGGLRSQ
jgi:hypothetical protein